MPDPRDIPHRSNIPFHLSHLAFNIRAIVDS